MSPLFKSMATMLPYGGFVMGKREGPPRVSALVASTFS
jgi:hypothetical protein